MPTTSHTIILKVRDISGVLVRIAHIFARRGYNIQSLKVEPDAGTQWSTMTIVVTNAIRIQDITGSLEKLVDVMSVRVQSKS
jgi:acetolactate synthase small subunit